MTASTEQEPVGMSHPRALRWSLVFGALSDWVFGFPLLLFPDPFVISLHLPSTTSSIYLRLIGLLLFVVSLFYLVTALDPGRYLLNVGVAILGRILGSIFYSIYVLGFGGERAFLLPVAVNLAFAFLHAWALGPRGWSRLLAALPGRS
jgi:hypothetical protein